VDLPVPMKPVRQTTAGDRSSIAMKCGRARRVVERKISHA
jgi:hypothetical protein